MYENKVYFNIKKKNCKIFSEKKVYSKIYDSINNFHTVEKTGILFV